MGVYEDYKEKTFTEEGYATLLNYTKTLIREYAQHDQTQYPFQIGIVFGVPFFNEHKAMYFANQSELLGRIQGYMQLLMINALEVDYGNSTILFELPKVN